VKGTKRTSAKARVVVLPEAIFSTTVRCCVVLAAPTGMTSQPRFELLNQQDLHDHALGYRQESEHRLRGRQRR
jgi:hypothetical protein